ncbi:acetate kinase [Glaciecola punicea ACAM 611]|uniref:Acetate kinase n=1 Tax=Glaciecola punicea ACAM 611 TaxID=1121923 RepID=H5T7L5_9ALTE|nr:acetate kinase [Glaciecola punicea]OFA32912.1 acetate kinase [Glaciecola punicea]GAB54292.1 acetate kinase [Glaciecola punicea ACAM 611]
MSTNGPYILVLNCGSSSIKFAIIAPSTGETPLKGLVENLFTASGRLTYEAQGEKIKSTLPAKADHTQALQLIVEILNQFKQLKGQLVAVGHRVVHGGEFFAESALINEAVIQAIHKTSNMAPLHNPANLAGIRSAQLAFPLLPQVAVFDTAFFQTLPKEAFLYALPYSLYEAHGVRKYGFHGTSHYFVSHKAAQMLNKEYEECNLISAHLGNGCSIAAIKHGRAVDTSMGFTPLEGLVMGTRSGDMDPSLPSYMIEQLGYSAADVNSILNKESGLKGISGLSNDCRELEAQAKLGNEQAQLALDMFCYRLVKYIGAYMAVVGTLDALIFTGGIGENSAYVRSKVVSQLYHLGLVIDEALNDEMRFGRSGGIHQPASLPVLAIATKEEWVIAQDSARFAK